MSADPEELVGLPPFARQLGIVVAEASAERVVARLDWAPHLCTAGGIMHGGALMSLAVAQTTQIQAVRPGALRLAQRAKRDLFEMGKCVTKCWLPRARISSMPRLPRVNDSLLVRTDFASDRMWALVCAEAKRTNDHGFQAYVATVSDRWFDGAPWQAVLAEVPANDMGAAVLFIADNETLTQPQYPVLAVSLRKEHGAPFRCVAAELATVESNLNVDKLSWADFASQVGLDGVFRGFLPAGDDHRTDARVVGG